MLLNLSDLSSESLQSQIIRQVRAKILAGELDAGAALPSIRSLARQQRVSVITVQRAYEALIREGLLLARRGKGFFVAPLEEAGKRDMARRRLIERLDTNVDAALAEGLELDEIRRVVNRYFDDKEQKS